MPKIAVIFESSPFDRKGMFNSIHNRVRHLAESGEHEVEAYCLHSRDNFLTRRLRRNPKVPHDKTVVIDGIVYHMLWYPFSIADHFRVGRFHRSPARFDRFVTRKAALFKDFDMVAAHSFEGGYMAMHINERYGIPYYVSWHGSDIHTKPLRNPYILSTTRKIMDKALFNAFVSRTLMEISSMISEDAVKTVLYNGVSGEFRRYPDERRAELRAGYGVCEGEKVVAYVGNFHKVKNVEALPYIFHKIHEDAEDLPLRFWLVGDGKLREKVEPLIRCSVCNETVFWGNVPPEEMPDILNCVDVLVLPSRNEGLPLVAMEAISCGAEVVGSDVGGISEVIGKDNVVPFRTLCNGDKEYLGEEFVNRFAWKVLGALSSPSGRILPDHFDWNATCARELSMIKNLFHD